MPLPTIRDEPPPLNLLPLIDIMLMLIVFFLVGAEFTEEERRIQLEVPRVADRGILPETGTARVVNVYQDGTLTLDGRPVTLADLTQQLAAARQQYPGSGVLVRGDGSGRVDRIVTVLHACRQAGIGELGISVRAGKLR